MQALALRIGIIALIAGGAWVFRPFLMGDAGSLAVGDCFDPPTDVDQTVEEVQHHPCSDPHGAEVIFVADYQPATDVYPSTDEFRAFVLANCIPAFNSYTGLNYDVATDLDVGSMWPTAESWSGGDKEMSCYAVRVDGSNFSQSIKTQ